MVSFNVHGVQFVPKTEEPIDPLQDEGTYLTLPVLLPCILKFRISTSKRLELRNSWGLRYNDLGVKALTYGGWEYSHDSRLLIDISLFVVHMLSMLVKQVKDEQAYIVMREQMHRDTAESTNGRVKWWSTFQMAVLVAEGIFQVWWLKRFFEVRRSLHAQFCFTNQWFCAYR